MFWIVYILSVILLSYAIAFNNEKYSSHVFTFLMITLLTPAKIDASSTDYAPSLFIFFFNALFEQDFSTRVLRPLALTLPIGIFSFAIVRVIRRRFFLQ